MKSQVQLFSLPSREYDNAYGVCSVMGINGAVGVIEFEKRAFRLV